MNETVDPKKQWHAMLTMMLEEYRIGHPDDHRGDIEIVEDLMDHFVESGLIKKKDGKYIIPKLTNDA